MKTTPIILSCLVAVLALAGTAYGNTGDESVDRSVSIEYVNPEEFTDLESSFSRDSKTRRAFALAIEEELERRLRASFGEDARLSLVISEVDLAGRIDPASFNEIRVLKSVWPPKMEFTYKLTSADGEILKEGEERLVDLGYLGFARHRSKHERFRYEREMVKDWLRGLARELAS
ncbi:MAG: DUF3016 domain-containing protein [Opitutales bacterium]